MQKLEMYSVILISCGLAFIPTASASIITDGSFENVSPALPQNGICGSTASGAPYPVCSAAAWTGAYQIGNGATIGIYGVSFNIPQPDPAGVNALILQGNGSTAIQSIDVPTAGSYTLSFYAANRSAPAGNSGPQSIGVLINNSLVLGGLFNNLPCQWTLEDLTFHLNSGVESLTLEGLGPVNRDISAFVDDVSLSASSPEPSSMLLIAIGLIALGSDYEPHPKKDRDLISPAATL